jgi:copper oxidase (laccase) domain-containing protein
VQSDVPDALLSGPVAGFAPGYIRDIGGGRFSVDLKGICAQTLRQKGVERIFVSKACTCCESELFFSHRRTGLPRGGMAACICLV